MTTEVSEGTNFSEKDSETILRTVSLENGFRFTTEKGVYDGITAISLEDFASKLKDLDANSLAYQYYRGDFQRWIDNTLGDKNFADDLCFIRTNISAEQLRQELLKRLDKRLKELKSLKWIETEGI